MHTNEAAPAPKPVARPRRIDVVPARPRPLVSVAIMAASRDGRLFRYSACSDRDRWTGTLEADAVETAVLDVIRRVRTESPDDVRLRFLVQVPPRSTLWALRDEIAALMPGVCIERPGLADEHLVRAACGCLPDDKPVARGPVYVATDGSVRGKVAGYGWLASSGEYGLGSSLPRRRVVGPKVVLVTELRAIADAVEALRGRDITVLSDSKLAVEMVQRWMAGDSVLPVGYTVNRESGTTPRLVVAQQMIYEERDRIRVVWVKGHQGEPLNEGADALARLASRFALGDSGLDKAEYRRRADGLATSFVTAFNERQSA